MTQQTMNSEHSLIDRARDAVSQSNWVVGECAALWTKKYARGRTDADFGQLLGLSGDQVYSRRRVWETFGDSVLVRNFEWLKWSHFWVAINWEDAEKCLTWAGENEATVAEMRAWRRAQNGEDLFAGIKDESDWASPPTLNTFSMDDKPHEFERPDSVASPNRDEQRDETAQVVTEDDRPAAYAPFSAKATTPPASPEEKEDKAWERSMTMLDRMARSFGQTNRAKALAAEYRRRANELDPPGGSQ